LHLILLIYLNYLCLPLNNHDLLLWLLLLYYLSYRPILFQA
jgi:hypothetical protein